MRARLVLIVLVCLLLACASTLPAPALAQGTTIVHIDQSPVSVGVGHVAPVEVRVEGVKDLYAYDIRLSFDPQVVEVVDADSEEAGVQAFPGDLLQVDVIARNLVDNTQGTVWFAMTQLNPTEPVSGSGAALILFMRGKKAGASSALNFTSVTLATRDGEEIAVTSESGRINVVNASEPEETPSPLPTPVEPTLVLPTPAPATEGPPPTATPPSATAAGEPAAQAPATLQPAAAEEPLQPAPSATAAAEQAQAPAQEVPPSAASTAQAGRAAGAEDAPAAATSGESRLPAILSGVLGLLIIAGVVLVGWRGSRRSA